MDNENLQAAALALGFGVEKREQADRVAIRVAPENLVAVLTQMRDRADLKFDFLLDHTCIDFKAEDRFELVYQLFSTEHGHYVMVTTSVSRQSPLVPTATSVWPIAEFQEREVYDLFGILYQGHPDLRRLFLEDDWVGFPLRKDYQDDFMLERPV